MASTHASPVVDRGFLGFIERIGNKLPDPVFLFIGATVLVMALSAAGSMFGWQVQPLRPQVVTETVMGAGGEEEVRPRLDASGRPSIELVETGDPLTPRSLLSGQGVYWLVSNMIRNFLNFPPLGVVVVSMLGIGVAEKVGLFSAAMKWVAGLVPSTLLTPTVILLGILSHITGDAGYIVLPPLAGGLFAVFKRPPLAGIAAAFAGIGGGFSANLLVGSTDALVSGITEAGARSLDPAYTVLPTCNWYFMAASTVMLTLVGWLVTARIVEPRLARKAAESLHTQIVEQGESLSAVERRGLGHAGIWLVVAVVGMGCLLFIPGAPLAGLMPAPAPTYGPIPDRDVPPQGAFVPADGDAEAGGPREGTVTIPKGFTVEAGGTGADGAAVRGRFVLSEPATGSGRLERTAAPLPRWSTAIVPVIVVVFLTPGIAYGISTGSLRTQKDLSRAFYYAMEAMAPVIALAFFAAQFIESFKYSGLDRMLAFLGGEMLASSGLSPVALLVGIVIVTMVVNLLISSMSAKWTILAPIMVPMMMMVGVSPELTQSAYRVGDSVTNIVTPLNTYAIVILAAMQRYQKDVGMGPLLAMMTPYSLVFAAAWVALLMAFVLGQVPTGPAAPMWYVPGR